ncbi:hypothetical protein CYMTET_35985 [Cymbomonas tetramitiformis]|uniref:Uncharacterized protein n=1 Tax=Cymbomonas tetramitiformis TaxID=36881 RepID=A0AAE0F855_9CHLO|nr:hypothetical protein CYMTET_35985 [Cymbomonas tetramitiformis]
MGSGDQHFEERESSDEDESQYPLGYYDDSDSCEEGEVERHGHLAAPYFPLEQLERDETLDTGLQGDSYGGVLEPPVGDEFLPHPELSVGTVSYVQNAIPENEILSHYEEYTTTEWAAWEAEDHASHDTGGDGFYDEYEYFETSASDGYSDGSY